MYKRLKEEMKKRRVTLKQIGDDPDIDKTESTMSLL